MGAQVFIGIAGASCSGKTTVARLLAERLAGPVAMVVLDDYYRDLSHLSPDVRAKWNFDSPDAIEHELLEKHLDALAGGQSFVSPQYDFTTHTRASGTKTVYPERYVIVEGLFALYWEDVRERLDVRVFVDAPDAVCYARRKERDVLERGRTEASVEEQYAATVRPMYVRYCAPTKRYADLVLDGEGDIRAAVELVLDAAGCSKSGEHRV